MMKKKTTPHPPGPSGTCPDIDAAIEAGRAAGFRMHRVRKTVREIDAAAAGVFHVLESITETGTDDDTQTRHRFADQVLAAAMRTTLDQGAGSALDIMREAAANLQREADRVARAVSILDRVARQYDPETLDRDGIGWEDLGSDVLAD